MKIINKIILYIMLLVLLLTSSSYAVPYAATMGTNVSNANTTTIINEAADIYDTCGYTNTRRLIDPSYNLIVSNMAAEVQFFSCHGAVHKIEFANSGIIVGNDVTTGGREYLGTSNTFFAMGDTALAVFAACNTAGENNVLDTNSITYQAAVEGMEAVVGFRDVINIASLESWSERFNQKLADGYGVYDAVTYANTFTYLYGNVKRVHVVHHGEGNVKIGSYRTNNARNILNTYNKRESLLTDVERSLVANESNIFAILKNKNDKFNENNYEIIRNEFKSTNMLTKESEVIEYVDLIFKVGDYLTEEGYSIEIIDGKINNIYDNNRNLAKQIEMLEKIESFVANEPATEVINTEKMAISEFNLKYNIKDSGTSVESTKYFYDLENDKKYIVIEVKNEKEINGEKSYLYDLEKYEI